jgi:hypothetical protein
MQIQSINHTTIYHAKIKKVYCCLIAHSELMSRMRSVQLSLADRRDFTGTSQPMLGVLFFPLSPPSAKGPHTLTRESTSSQLASQGRATTPHRAGYPNSHKLSQSSIYFLQCNVTQNRRIHHPSPPSII